MRVAACTTRRTRRRESDRDRGARRGRTCCARRAADAGAGAGEVLIRVAASGVNRPDVLQRKGLLPGAAGRVGLPGLEVAGTIVDGDAAALPRPA